MNRVIKFRGKVKNSNEWKYGSLLTYADGECNIITETGHRIDTWNVDPETVGQFTGKIDRNGKEVYEGDIVVFTGCLPTVCKWINGWYLYYEAFREQTFNLCAFLSSDLAVVGNIYDNPELEKEIYNEPQG